MNLRQYQEIDKLSKDLSDDQYKAQLCRILNVSIDDHTDDQINSLVESTRNEIKAAHEAPITPKFKLNKQWYSYDKEISKQSFGQWVQFDTLMNTETDIIQNMHNLLAVYVRAIKFNWFKLKREMTKYDSNELDDIAETIREHMDIKTAIALNVFFYKNVSGTMKHTAILCSEATTRLVDNLLTEKKSKN
jgi:hypothetical protein